MSAPGLRERLAGLSPAARATFLGGLGPEELTGILYDWQGVWARPEQLPPDDGEWSTFLYLAGRGAGKTRAASEWTRKMAREHPGCRIAVVARTAADSRDVCVEGESGLLAVCPPAEKPLYEPSKRRLTWRNGSQATTYSADEPDLLRGPQHHFAWCDELATWPRLGEAWANLQLGLRVGERPRCFVSTTPRPLPLLRELLKNARTVVHRGSTFDNAANLAPSALAEFRARYEGTRLGRQELHAEILDDVPGALWNRAMIEERRVWEAPDLVRVVVAVDPAVTSGEDSDETGIVVAGLTVSGHVYVLADRSCRLSPDGWARRVVATYDEFRADRVVAEVNNGGDLVEQTIRTVRASVPFTAVHATRGKRVRAEPIAALYEQGRVHHVGAFPELEDQMCTFAPDVVSGSPDRLDALVWALTDLSVSVPGLVAPAVIAAAQARDVSWRALDHEASCWGLVARYGSAAILRERAGPVAFRAHTLGELSASELASRVSAILTAAKRQPSYLFVDLAGVGGSALDALGALGHRRILVPVDLGGKPHDPRFADRGTELYWTLAEWLKRGCLPSEATGLADGLAAMAAPVHKVLGGRTVLALEGPPRAAEVEALALTFGAGVAPPSVPARAAQGATKHERTWREASGRTEGGVEP